MKKAHVFLVMLGILAIAGVAIVAVLMADKTNNQDRFSVDGSGTVYAKADIANLSVGLKTEVKKTAAEATKENTDKMNEILDAVRKLGIDSKDIKTSSYSLNPVYNWTEADGQKLIGYEVYQGVTLKVRDLDKIGDIIAKTTEKGANQVGNIAFTIDDEYELKNQARELAIEKAKEKAEMIAEQTGMKLGDIKGVYESSEAPTMAYDYSNARKEMAVSGSSAAIAAPSIEAGQNEIKVNVTLSYEIK
jgi:hypothetical protein